MKPGQTVNEELGAIRPRQHLNLNLGTIWHRLRTTHETNAATIDGNSLTCIKDVAVCLRSCLPCSASQRNKLHRQEATRIKTSIKHDLHKALTSSRLSRRHSIFFPLHTVQQRRHKLQAQRHDNATKEHPPPRNQLPTQRARSPTKTTSGSDSSSLTSVKECRM